MRFARRRPYFYGNILLCSSGIEKYFVKCEGKIKHVYFLRIILPKIFMFATQSQEIRQRQFK